MTTYTALRTATEQADGLYLTTMETLRDAHGAGKLGVHVRKAIHDELLANGLGHLPSELPAYQEYEVRLYRLGTSIANAINAVLYPSEAGDQVLRQTAGSSAQTVLKQIRELVCE